MDIRTCQLAENMKEEESDPWRFIVLIMLNNYETRFTLSIILPELGQISKINVELKS